MTPRLRISYPLFDRTEGGHIAAMTGPPKRKPTSKLGRLVWPSLTALFIAGIAWELCAGAAYHRTGGSSARVSHPDLFWSEIAFQIVITLLCASVAYRALRSTSDR